MSVRSFLNKKSPDDKGKGAMRPAPGRCNEEFRYAAISSCTPSGVQIVATFDQIDSEPLREAFTRNMYEAPGTKPGTDSRRLVVVVTPDHASASETRPSMLR